MLIASRPSAIPARIKTAATHLRTGQQGVADAGCGRGSRGDQHEVETQREPLAQRQQLQGQQHGEGDNRGDVQPAHRQQVGEPASPHRVGVIFIHRILVASGQRDRDPGGPDRKAPLDMRAQIVAGLVEAAGLGGMHDRYRPHRLADRADLFEPGVAREVIGAGKRHRRRRREPGLEPYVGARRDARRKFVLVDRNADPRRKLGTGRPKQQPNCLLGGKIIDAFDPRGEVSHDGAFEPRLGNTIRPDPY
jgi:hypothetical protein